MNSQEKKYSQYALCREMLETAEVMKNYMIPEFPMMDERQPLFLTGEGSSRIFPAKHSIYRNRMNRGSLRIETEGATQALEYDLRDALVLGASNSGKTKELIRLYKELAAQGHNRLYGLTANPSTPLEEISAETHVLTCGGEEAVAATKSVAEQALFVQGLVASIKGRKLEGVQEAGRKLEEVLNLKIDSSIVESLSSAETIYFAGRNNGVAEELALKTNEITRKKSAYLEGTYLLHGIEEVLNEKDVIIVVDPFESEEEKIMECLVKGVGLPVVAISTGKTLFPTVQIPQGGEFHNYLELAAGWNLLVEIGLALGVDLDKPVRARKVGNEFPG